MVHTTMLCQQTLSRDNGPPASNKEYSFFNYREKLKLQGKAKMFISMTGTGTHLFASSVKEFGMGKKFSYH